MILNNNFLFLSALNSFNKYPNIDLLFIYLMLIASLIPIFAIANQSNILNQLASASSFGSKLSLIIIFYSFIKACVGDLLLINKIPRKGKISSKGNKDAKVILFINCHSNFLLNTQKLYSIKLM